MMNLDKELDLLLDELELRAKNSSDTEELDQVFKRLKEIEQEKLNLRTGLTEKFSDLLSHEQIAHLIIFEYRFPHQMRNLIEEYRGGMQGGPGHHRGQKGPGWWDD